MGVFEYLGVLVSVIMGLGITHMAAGATKLIQNRDEVRFYWPHALWTVNILMHIMMIWWGMFWWSKLEDWSAFGYMFIAIYAIALFFNASMLYPWDMEKKFDVRDYFFRNRRWFFGAQLAAWLIDIPETLSKETAGLRDVPADYGVFVGTMLAIAVTGWISGNRTLQRILPIVWFLVIGYYVFLSAVGQIDG